jgi:NodT family efflux transporter outer membrane factor (OMF) lipoprotein
MGAGPDHWWQQFADPELASLMTRSLSGNLDLQAAASRIRAAREQLILAGAARLPSVNADASANETHLSKNSGISEFAKLLGGGGSGGQGGGSGASGFGVPGTSFTTYSLGFDASWEIDAFGGVRRSIQAAQARAEQALWSLRDSEVSVSAEVATDYFALRSLQRQLAITRDEIDSQRHMLTLVQARQQAGFVTGLDVQQQTAQLALTESTLPALDAQALAQIHALAVLAGQAPEALEGELTPVKPLPAVLLRVPVGLPSDLLRRRPDIRVAERALAASSADIGVAVAALFPKINLSGALDLVSLDLSHLLEGSSAQYSATGAISWPIFAGGEVRANIRLKKEQDQQALYAYSKSVIGALRDVEDSLQRYADEKQTNDALHRAVDGSTSATRIASFQYRAGLTDFTSVLTAQDTEFRAQSQLAQSNGNLARDLASIYKAIGGGW